MRSARLLATVLASTLALATLAYANDTPGSPHATRFQQRMGLTDDQVSAMREVRGRHAAEFKQLYASLHQAQAELRQLALSGADQATIKAKTAEVAGLLAQTVELRTTTLQEIAPILTPEQREKMMQLGSHGGWHHRQGPATQGS
jgi:Spy/CpxP family protein refolding chaperone